MKQSRPAMPVPGDARPFLETPRLLLRRPVLAEVPALFVFLGDAASMNYTRVDASLRECRRRVAVHEWRRRHHGYAPWTITTKADGKIIGWGGLYREPGWDVEVAYFFHPAAWGKGYATELVAACLSLADNMLDLPAVTAFAHPENLRSQRVLTKAGFDAVRYLPEMNRLLYHRETPSS